MSGCSYSCTIYPEAAHCDYRPSVDQLELLLRAMTSGGWLDAGKPRTRGAALHPTVGHLKVPLDPSALRHSLELLVACGSYRIDVDNERDEGDPTPFEQDAAGVFRPQYCESAHIRVSAARVAVGDLDCMPDTILCPACRSSLLVDIDEHADACVKYLSGPESFVPETCPGCGVILDPLAIIATIEDVVDGSTPRVETAPFAKFSLVLYPVEKRYPETEVISVDEGLVRLVGGACGVPFRSIGQLQCS